MKNAYIIKGNEQYGSNEIYFEGKPSADVRTALKKVHFRWNPKKKCWYGFKAENELVSLLNGAGETVTTDGYLGGGGFFGANSGKHLYGSELSKAVRADLKARKIAGCSVSCSTYSGGQHLRVKIKRAAEDIIPFEDFVKDFRISGGSWIYYLDDDGNVQNMWIDVYMSDKTDQEDIRMRAARYEYSLYAEDKDLRQQSIGADAPYTDSLREKVEAVREVITSYRCDESNGFVDYFDTNFYYSIEIKAPKEA